MEKSFPKLGYACITGAASGLGRELAVLLAGRGWHMALADRDRVGTAETASLCASAASVQLVHLDVTSADSWNALRGQLQSSWPRCDMLIQAAGVTGAGEIGQFSLDDWEWIVQTNLIGPIYGCHALVPWLRQNPGARIVNIASLAAVGSFPSMGAYNVAKSGVVSLSETLSGELRPAEVSVTVALPGFFATPLVSRGRFADAALRQSGQSLMDKAKITATDVAHAILRGAERRRLYVIVPRRARVVWLLKRLSPAGLTRIAGWLYQRERQSQSNSNGNGK